MPRIILKRPKGGIKLLGWSIFLVFLMSVMAFIYLQTGKVFFLVLSMFFYIAAWGVLVFC